MPPRVSLGPSVSSHLCFGRVCPPFPLSTEMLSLVDQLLVTGPLLGRELGVDLGPHARFDRVELGPDARPERIGLGAVACDDRAHGLSLRGTEAQLAAQVGDERVWTAAASHPPRTSLIAFRGLAAAPAGQPTGHEHGGQ